MVPTLANQWLDLVIKTTAVVGIAGTALVTAYGIWRPIKRTLLAVSRALHLADKFHELFGITPAQAILDRFTGVELRMSQAEIITELQCAHYNFAVYICDRDGACTFVNEALLRLFRISLAEAIGYGWIRVLAPEEKERVVIAWEQSIKLRTPYEAHYTVHGTRCVTRAVPLRIDGKVNEYIGYVVPERMK